jgi:hypothetical protein
MLFEESSHDPLANSESNLSDQKFDSSLIIHCDFINSFKEEFFERI